MSRSFHGLAFLGAVCCAALIGCGPKSSTVPVQGTLTIDGKPAESLVITLTPLDTSMALATGKVTNGSFELFTGIKGLPGAVPGKYKVVLAPSANVSEEAARARYSGGGSNKPAAGGGSVSPDVKTALPFAQKYSSSTTSDKEVEITSGKNNLTIDVSSK